MTPSLESVVAQIKSALEAGPASGPWTWRQVKGMGPRVFLYSSDQDWLPMLELDAASFPTCDFIATCNPQAIRILLDALGEAQRDAKRYRWLRNKSVYQDAISVIYRYSHEGHQLERLLHDNYLDAAIDKAMEQPK